MRGLQRLPHSPGRYPWRVVCRNLEYPGEVVVSDSWRPELGQTLTGDTHFRIVILRQPLTVPVTTIKEPRAAFVVPASQSQASHGVREPAPSYQADALPWGQVLTPGPALDSGALLTLPTLEGRLEALARSLLEAAYPNPLNTEALPRPLDEEACRLVFEGLLGRASPHALEAATSFAPALGLARPDQPQRFDPQECPLFPTLREQLDQSHGHWKDPCHELGHRYGLPAPLATLYLLAFVSWGQPPTEIRLAPGSAIPLSTGGSLHSLITAPLIPTLSWGRDMVGAISGLDYSSHVSWNTALPYARQIRADLKPAGPPPEIEEQVTTLRQALSGLAQGVSEASIGLEVLVPSLGNPPEAARRALARLEELACCQDYVGFWQVAARGRATPEDLGRDLALLRRLRGLALEVGEVAQVRRYLEGAEVDEAHGELALDRISLLEQVTLANLLAQDGLWLALESLFRWFRGRYRPLYEAHHRRYRQRMTELRQRIEGAQRLREALARLNSVVELGPPLHPELVGEHQRLLASLQPCPQGDIPGLDREPRCPACQVSLAQEPPQAEVAAFLAKLEWALKEQHRRLSSQAVRFILARTDLAPIDRFLQVVQAGDLSALAEVMDDEVAAFLRQLMAKQEQA